MGYTAASVEVTPLSRMFKALGDEVRLRIVALLSHGELCVCHVEEALELTQTNTSRQLGILRAAGLVAPQRRDKWVYYRLARQTDPDRRRHLKALVTAFSKEELLQKDVERLLKVRGPGACK